MKRFSIFISMCLFLFSACNLPLITLEIETFTQSETPLVYNVENIVFVNHKDELLSTQNDFGWESFWNTNEDLILAEFNTTFGENSVIQEGKGNFSIVGGVQEISSEDFHALRKALDSVLDYKVASAYYDFTVVYDAASNIISIVLISHNINESFNALQFDSNMNDVAVTVQAELVGVSEYLAIYAKQGSSMSDTDMQYLMDEFDKIYPTLIAIYGTHSDLDNNNKVILLLYDINKDFVSGGYVAGFFNPVDLYPQYSESNDAEILYVEGNISGSRYNIYTTLIHEFQHLINTSVTLSTGKRSDLWLNEALSESTEIIYAKAMSANRLNVYNGYSHEYITRGNNFYFWNDADDVLSNYSTASLFMYWLYLHGGEQIIEDIARSQYGNYRAIEDAVKASNSSYLNSLSSWEEVVFAWYEANENYTTGYKNAIVSQNVGNSFNLTSKINKNYGASALLNVGSVILTESEVTINNIDIVQDSFTKGGKTVHLTMNNQKTATDSATIRVSIPASKAPSARSALQDFVPLYDDGGYNIIHIPQSSFDIEALEQ